MAEAVGGCVRHEANQRPLGDVAGQAVKIQLRLRAKQALSQSASQAILDSVGAECHYVAGLKLHVFLPCRRSPYRFHRCRLRRADRFSQEVDGKLAGNWAHGADAVAKQLFVIVAEAFHRGLFHGVIIWKPGLAL